MKTESRRASRRQWSGSSHEDAFWHQVVPTMTIELLISNDFGHKLKCTTLDLLRTNIDYPKKLFDKYFPVDYQRNSVLLLFGKVRIQSICVHEEHNCKETFCRINECYLNLFRRYLVVHCCDLVSEEHEKKRCFYLGCAHFAFPHLSTT